VALAPYTLARKSTEAPYTLARKSTEPATKLNVYVDFVASFGNSGLSTKSTMLNSTLSPVCTGLKWLGIVTKRLQDR